MTHIWHEDSQDGATSQLWRFLQTEGVLALEGEVEIRGLSGCENLLDYILNENILQEDTYFIFMDYVMDNSRTLRTYDILGEITEKYPNIFISTLLCFEYLLLKSTVLKEWVLPLQPSVYYEYVLSVRDRFISCIENGSLWLTDDLLCTYILSKIDNKGAGTGPELLRAKTSEQVATYILWDLVNSVAPDFRVMKSMLGKCWTCSCCVKRNGNKICRICNEQYTAHNKAEILYAKLKISQLLTK